MHSHKQTRVRVDGASIVFQMSAISCADFDHASAGISHNIRYSEVAADLDELSSRNDRLSVARKHRENQECCRGAVVYDQCIFSAAQVFQQRLNPGCSTATHTTLEVVFD